MNELQTLALSLGLPATATLAEVQAKQNLLLSQNASLTAELATLRAQETQRQQTEIATVLNSAVQENRITAAQRPFYEKLFAADFVSTKAIIDGLPKVVKLSDVPAPKDGGNGKFTYQGKTFSQLSKDDPTTLETLKANDFSTFNQLYKAEFGRDYKTTER